MPPAAVTFINMGVVWAVAATGWIEASGTMGPISSSFSLGTVSSRSLSRPICPWGTAAIEGLASRGLSTGLGTGFSSSDGRSTRSTGRTASSASESTGG